jgi:hypothetical protein
MRQIDRYIGGKVLAVNIGVPELVILFVLLCALALPVVIVVLVLRSAKQRSSNQGPFAATAPTLGPAGQSSPAGQWAADPFGRHQLRYYDGAAWTQHVLDDGRPSTDPPQ